MHNGHNGDVSPCLVHPLVKEPNQSLAESADGIQQPYMHIDQPLGSMTSIFFACSLVPLA